MDHILGGFIVRGMCGFGISSFFAVYLYIYLFTLLVHLLCLYLCLYKLR